MSMRDQNQIAVLQRCDLTFAFLKNWIRQPGINKKHVPSRRDDFECGLPVPGELRLRGCSHARHQSEDDRAGKMFRKIVAAVYDR